MKCFYFPGKAKANPIHFFSCLHVFVALMKAGCFLSYC